MKWCNHCGYVFEGHAHLPKKLTTLFDDNEKAAIAAGLWWVGKQCAGNQWYFEENDEKVCHCCGAEWHPWELKEPEHGLGKAPDMRDPANLWRAMENVCKQRTYGIELRVDGDGACYAWFDENALYPGTTLAEALFAALVALYDAEHQGEK